MDQTVLRSPHSLAETPVLRAGTVVLPLGNGVVQVGTTPGHSFILANITEPEEIWIRSLVANVPGTVPPPVSARKNRPQVSEDADSIQRRRFILDRLLESGLIAPGRLSAMADLRIRLVGLDRLGIPLARLLADSGVRYLDLRDSRDINPEVEYLFDKDQKGMLRQCALQQNMKARGIFTSRHAMPNLVITVDNRTINHHRAGVLLNHDAIHLPIVVEDRSITLGPLLIPGLTCCYLCLDFHKRDSIPNWPHLRETLRKLPIPAQSVALCATAAALAAHLIESFVDPLSIDPTGKDSGVNWFLGREWQVNESGVETVHWQPHPQCRCQLKPSAH